MSHPPAVNKIRIRVEGTGPVALACALWLVRAGVPAQQISLDLGRPAPALPPPHATRRAIALSEGSCQTLSRLITLPPAGQIHTVQVFQGATTGHTRIDRRDFPLPALGSVVVWEALTGRLHDAARQLPFAVPEPSPSSSAALTIHAAGMPVTTATADRAYTCHDTGQAGLLFEVQVNDTTHTAFECFLPHGPLALLPAPPHANGARYTVVWSDLAATTQQRSQYDAHALGLTLGQTLRQALGPRHWRQHSARFGPLRVCTPAHAVALPRISRRTLTAPAQVWIGNAAQMLHPVAGQGLNLGLRDAFMLAGALGDALADRRLPGPHAQVAQALENYVRARRTDRQATIHGTDLLSTLFGYPLARHLAPTLLNSMHVLPPLRAPLAHALVFGHR